MPVGIYKGSGTWTYYKNVDVYYFGCYDVNRWWRPASNEHVLAKIA